MILLVTASDRGSDCAHALRQATGDEVILADDLVRATPLLRAHGYRAVVWEQHLIEAEPLAYQKAMAHIGSAISLPMNFAITGMERLLREVKTALQRRQREEVALRRATAERLQRELNPTLTAIVLSTDLALESDRLSPILTARLHTLHELVEKLRRQLEQWQQPTDLALPTVPLPSAD